MDNERTHIFNYLCLKKHTQINTKNIYLVLLLYIEIDDLFISLLKLLLNWFFMELIFTLLTLGRLVH